MIHNDESILHLKANYRNKIFQSVGVRTCTNMNKNKCYHPFPLRMNKRLVSLFLLHCYKRNQIYL
jgi:hypothetical protein